MKQMLFEINDDSCHILFTNSPNLYVIGIGDTDYTIHRDAREIFNWHLRDKPRDFYDFIDNKFQIVHYFARNLQTILHEGIKREFLKIAGNIYKLIDVKIEIPNKVETYIEFYGRKNNRPELKYKLLTDKLSEHDKFWFKILLEKIDDK